MQQWNKPQLFILSTVIYPSRCIRNEHYVLLTDLIRFPVLWLRCLIIGGKMPPIRATAKTAFVNWEMFSMRKIDSKCVYFQGTVVVSYSFPTYLMCCSVLLGKNETGLLEGGWKGLQACTPRRWMVESMRGEGLACVATRKVGQWATGSVNASLPELSRLVSRPVHHMSV